MSRLVEQCYFVASLLYNLNRGRRGRDRMVVGFITSYAISDFHHYNQVIYVCLFDWWFLTPLSTTFHYIVVVSFIDGENQRNRSHWQTYCCTPRPGGVQWVLCCVFVLFFFVLCTLHVCCQFLWIVHLWLPLRHSLMFILVMMSRLVEQCYFVASHYIVVVSFIDGENQRNRSHWQTYCCTPRPDRDSNSEHQWWKSLIAHQ
jgi:hypothetical protein